MQTIPLVDINAEYAPEWMSQGFLQPLDDYISRQGFDTTPFFPFLPAEASSPIILNKAEVVVLSVVVEGELEEPGVESPHRRVQVECRERIVAGILVIDMPEGHQRVLDYLNRPDSFLVVRDGDREHLVRKERITRVTEPREA